MKILKCRDAGFDCNAVMRAETEAEVMQQAAEHAKAIHNLTEIPEQAVAQIRALIHDESPQAPNTASH